MGKRAPQREAKWRELISLWECSGQAVKAFCREHGVTDGTFYSWRRELRRRDGQAPARARRAKSAEDRFVQLTVAPAGSSIRIHLLADLIVEVPSTLDAGTLTQIFTAARTAVSC